MKSEISHSLDVLEPATEAELATVLSRANTDRLSVLPRGGGTKMDWGNPPERADVILSTRRLDRVLEHAAGDMTVTVEAGCTIANLQETLANQGQRLAIDPLWPEQATVGGVLATNDNGSLRHAYGSLRDLIIGVTVALPDGTLARSGGKVVKNVAGYDLPKLMVGALGTLGVITQATFRLHPRPRATRELSTQVPTPENGRDIVLSIRDSTLPVTALQVRATPFKPLRVDVRLEGSESSVSQASSRLPLVAKSARGEWSPLRDAWYKRELLFGPPAPADAVARVTFNPTDVGALYHALTRAMPTNELWVFVAQGYGVGWLGLGTSDAREQATVLASVRREAVALGGSLVVLRAAPSVKQGLNAWGEAGDALPLMRRVKEQFDPSRTLNPGRFVGGI